MNEHAGALVEVGMKHGSEQDRIHRRGAGVAGAGRVSVIGAVRGDAEVFAPISGDGEIHALQTVAGLVYLVEAGVAVAGVDLILVRGFNPLGGGRSRGWGNLACGRQGHKRGRNHGQNRKQQLSLQLETLLNTLLWLACRSQGIPLEQAP